MGQKRKSATTGWESDLARWCKEHVEITAYCARLSRADIPWAFYSGMTVSVLTATREPSDVDIMVRPEDLERIIALSPQDNDTIILQDPHDTVRCGDGVVLDFPSYGIRFWLGGMQVDVMATTRASYQGQVYELSLSKLAIQHRIKLVVDDVDVYVAHPFDTMAMKAVLQRGAEQNKFDLDDIAALHAVYDPDWAYINRRAREIGLDARAKDFLALGGLGLPRARSWLDSLPITPIHSTITSVNN